MKNTQKSTTKYDIQRLVQIHMLGTRRRTVDTRLQIPTRTTCLAPRKWMKKLKQGNRKWGRYGRLRMLERLSIFLGHECNRTSLWEPFESPNNPTGSTSSVGST